jgi:hypothetical protein
VSDTLSSHELVLVTRIFLRGLPGLPFGRPALVTGTGLWRRSIATLARGPKLFGGDHNDRYVDDGAAWRGTGRTLARECNVPSARASKAVTVSAAAAAAISINLASVSSSSD